MNKLKATITLLVLTFFSFGVFAQTDSKDVSITSSGSGKTLEDAKQAALRSSTERAFGAFISSKTEMFNDQVVADQMASVSSGNIKSYEVLNESQLPDGSWGVTLKTIVSVDKLTSFVEAKGIAIEIKGGMFALNIKQQLLNEQGEIKAISEMVGLLHEPMQISFDYVIKSSDPKSLDAESKNWEIPLVVTATTNKNIDFCANYCIKTLSALSLSSEEVTSYKSLNKAVFPVVIDYNGVTKTFYLRKLMSLLALNTLISNWEFYLRLFTVQSGIDVSDGFTLASDKYNSNSNVSIHKFGSLEKQEFWGESTDYKKVIQYGDFTINFLNTGQRAAEFSWQDKRTLSQIEQMTEYKVKAKGVCSPYKHGGFVVYELPPSFKIGVQMKEEYGNEVLLPTPGGIAEKAGIMPGDKIISINDTIVVNGNIHVLINKVENKDKICEFKIERAGNNLLTIMIHPSLSPGTGLVATISDLGEMDWNSAKTACDELTSNGYSDWRLPEKNELFYLYRTLKNWGVGNFTEDGYWSSSQNNGETAFRLYFTNSEAEQGGWELSIPYSVRAVRTF